MTVLLLRLAGPLQAWGDSSRFARRQTRNEPTKSGVLGLAAAAQGRRRTDEIEDLLQLRFGVRVDQPGELVRDFQTAQRWETRDSMPLSLRYYIADAVFVAGIEGEDGLVAEIDAALAQPRFPLYLGRRSCPVMGRLRLGISTDPLDDALARTPWQAANWYRRRYRGAIASLDVYTDASGRTPEDTQVIRDVPISFDPRRRLYGWRDVAHTRVTVPQGAGLAPDFFAAIGGQ